MSKTRLDVAMAAQGLAESRQKAQAIIMSGLVFVDGKRVDKCGAQIADTAVIEVRGKTLRYVSRGGLKLEKAMQCFPLTLQDGQLDWKLRQDERVVCMERTNARYLTKEQIPEPLDFVSVDVSFISLGLIFPALRPLLADNANLVCLIKPQFEAGKDKVGKKGVVRDANVHLAVLEQFLRHAAENDLTVQGMTYSPIKGPEGNIEYLGWLTAAAGENHVPDLHTLVETSHKELERVT